MRLILVVSSFLFFFGCASIHNGDYAVPEGAGAKGKSSASGIVISGSENTDLSSANFGEVDFTFENKTNEWIRVKNVTLDFGSPEANEMVKIPVGSDLLAWASAAQQNKQIKDYNTSLVLGSVALAGAAVIAGSAGSNSSGGMALGGAAYVGGLGGIGAMALHEERARIQLAALVPPSHLLAGDFVIPPGLHTKKWVTLYTSRPSPEISRMKVSYVLENGKSESASLTLDRVGSLWQRED